MHTAGTVYAFTLGMATVANPCGFPLLPAYLSRLAGEGLPEEGSGSIRRAAKSARGAFFVAAGFLAVFAVLGTLFDAGVTFFMSVVPWVMIPLAGVLAVYGIATLRNRTLPISRLSLRRPGAAFGGRGSLVLFGICYAAGSLTCSLPIFVAAIIPLRDRPAPLSVATSIGAFAAGMAAVLVLLAIAVSLASSSVILRIRHVSRYVEKAAGILLVLIGAYLMDYWITYLVSPANVNRPITLVERVQSWTAAGLAAHAVLLGAMAGALLAAVLLAVVARGSWKHPRSDIVPTTPPLSRKEPAAMGATPGLPDETPDLPDKAPGVPVEKLTVHA